MAKLSDDGKYVIVEKGDTLWEISRDHFGGGPNYKKLAAINNIKSPYYIYVKQKIYLNKEASSSGGGKTSTTSSSKTAVIDAFGLQSDTDNTLFATWTWSKESDTKSYLVEWSYSTGDKNNSGNIIWFIASSSEQKIEEGKDPAAFRQSTYQIPSNAKQVRLRVKPIPNKKTQKINLLQSEEVDCFEAVWSAYSTYDTDELPLDAPGTPSVKIEKQQLTAELTDIKVEGADSIEFQIYKNDKDLVKTSEPVTITTTKIASWSYKISLGAEYKVRARACKGDKRSEWSAFSPGAKTIPSTPSGSLTCKASSETSVYLEWDAVDTATKYDIERATKKEYFDGSDQTTSVTGIEFTHYEITGLESGQKYFFRVRATNDIGVSTWSEVVSVVIGKKPSAPTTWSSTTTVVTGEPLTLYWVHNAQDGSSQTTADLEIYANGTRIEPFDPIKNTTDEETKDNISYYILDTSSYTEGTKIEWRVRTAGVMAGIYGDWSIQRTVDVYAQPTVELRVTDFNGDTFETLTSFPFNVYALAGPNTQVPTGYQLTVTSNEIYETADHIGNIKIVNEGDQLYSEHFDTTGALRVTMTPSNLDLENGRSYTVTCTVSMNSGLTASASFIFSVSWSEVSFIPNAEITIDSATYTALVRPYCDDVQIIMHRVNYISGEYVVTGETLDYVAGEIVSGAKTTTGEVVYLGSTDSEDDVYYSPVTVKSTFENTSLAVYRREYDGTFTEIATGLDNAKGTCVTDPHPSLDYARYRIVATNNDTGAVGFYDLPGVPMHGNAVIIQWDEAWSSFDVSNEDALEQPPWGGSMLKLPYNIDVSDKYDMDVSLVEYIGRSHPVSYYGTQLGVSSSWRVNIPKTDKETLYALRRLAIWQGDVYVREPSGTGYWARINPSWSQTHCETTIPVTLEVTRVEGGM